MVKAAIICTVLVLNLSCHSVTNHKRNDLKFRDFYTGDTFNLTPNEGGYALMAFDPIKDCYTCVDQVFRLTNYRNIYTETHFMHITQSPDNDGSDLFLDYLSRFNIKDNVFIDYDQQLKKRFGVRKGPILVLIDRDLNLYSILRFRDVERMTKPDIHQTLQEL